jgi:hypothetical protein
LPLLSGPVFKNVVAAFAAKETPIPRTHDAVVPPAVAAGCSIICGENSMRCHDLVAEIERLHPEAETRDVARMCLLLTNSFDDLDRLAGESQLESAWKEMGLKVQAASDQHAAMTQELETLARSDPKRFSADQIWVLIRAIKVQSQVLQLYLGEPALDV